MCEERVRWIQTAEDVAREEVANKFITRREGARREALHRLLEAGGRRFACSAEAVELVVVLDHLGTHDMVTYDWHLVEAIGVLLADLH